MRYTVKINRQASRDLTEIHHEGRVLAPIGKVPLVAGDDEIRQPIGRRRSIADEALNAHEDEGRFAAPVDDEAFVVVHPWRVSVSPS
jgi:hypothetical protein